jgi:Peptidase M15
MRVLTVFAALGLIFGGLSLLFADRADAAYSDGGPIVLGNFSQGAYGSGIDHRDAPREEPRRSVRTAALAPTAYAPKAATTAPKSVTAPRKEEEGPPPAPPPRGLSDEQEQALLIEKSLIAVAYAKRKQEANPLWTCLHESGKQLLAHIEAEFGPVDISEGTCAKRSIAGTATLSQHAYGRAIDFLPGKGHSKQQIVAWLMAHRHEGWVSGIMTYATMSHIHVDTGPYHFVALNAR